jgi:hypothetical protein
MAIRLNELEILLTRIWTCYDGSATDSAGWNYFNAFRDCVEDSEDTLIMYLMSFELTSGEVKLLCQSDSTVKVQQATLAALKAGRSLRLSADSFNLVSDNYESPRCIVQVNDYDDVYALRDFFADTEGLEYIWLPQHQALGAR